MAEETVDKLVEVCNLKTKNGCMTAGLMLEGGHDWHPLLYIQLVQDFGLEVDVAQNLASTYGDRAFSVAKRTQFSGKRWPIMGKRLHPEFPYLETEVEYVMREYACTVVDVIARRLRLAFLNTYAAEEAIPRIVEIMAPEMGWDKNEKKAQAEQAKKFINEEMGKLARVRAIEDAPLNLTQQERKKAVDRFHELHKQNKARITVNDLRQYYKDKGERIDENLLHELLNEIDLNKNGIVDLFEFLQLWSGLIHGTVTRASSSFARLMAEMDHHQQRISADRSGGGI